MGFEVIVEFLGLGGGGREACSSVADHKHCECTVATGGVGYSCSGEISGLPGVGLRGLKPWLSLRSARPLKSEAGVSYSREPLS